MADDYVIDATVHVAGDAYDDPMDALSHVEEVLDGSDDVTRIDVTLVEEPGD